MKRWRIVAVVALLGAIAFVALSSRTDRVPRPDAGVIDAAIEASEPDAEPRSDSDDGDPFAVDASGLADMPAWPGWPLPKGHVLTPEEFCAGAVSPSLFIRNPRCSIAETRADVERNKKKPFGGFADVMARSTVTRCVARLTTSVDKGRVRLEPEAGVRCIAAAIEVAWDAVPSPVDTAACNGYVIGLRTEGQSCTDPWECIDGLACVGFTKKKDGRCKPLPALGAPCGNGEPDKNLPFDIGDRPACAKGARCEPWGGRCKRAKTRGEKCENDWDCEDELACRAHKCASMDRVTAGGACVGNAECAPTLFCAGTNYSDKPGVCTEKKPAGERCRDDSECKGHCEKLTCVAWCKSG